MRELELLLLDDEQSFCSDFAEGVKAATKHTVTYTTNYEDALGRILNTQPDQLPDMLFVDYNLGHESTGLDFIREIQSRGHRIPTVLLTNDDTQEVAFEAGRVGVRLFFQKKDSLVRDSDYAELMEYALKAYAEEIQAGIARRELMFQELRLLIREFLHDIDDVFVPISLSSAQINELLPKLERCEDTDTSALIVESIFTENGYVLEKVQEGKDLSKQLRQFVETGTYEVQNELHDVVETVERCAKSCLGDDKALEIIPKQSEFFFDQVAIRRALSNILRNVEMHLPTGAQVRVTIEAKDTAGEKLLSICVSDDGPGIPEDDWEKVLQPFVQGTEAGGNAGFGLGLAISKRYVELHRNATMAGSLTCGRCEHLGGAQFSILIPQGEFR